MANHQGDKYYMYYSASRKGKDTLSVGIASCIVAHTLLLEAMPGLYVHFIFWCQRHFD